MTPVEIKNLFPIDIIITKEIIKSSLYTDRNNCIAATALKTILPIELHNEIDWGTGIGRIKGVPIRSTMFNKEEDKYFDHYLQRVNTNENEVIRFIVDKTR